MYTSRCVAQPNNFLFSGSHQDYLLNEDEEKLNNVLM